LWDVKNLHGRLEGVINDLADKAGAFYDTPHSIVYTVSGEIFYCGPFKTEVEALKYVDDRRRKKGAVGWEFNLAEQYVYLIYPSHRQIHLSDKDFEVFSI
jgi:hypothetical protein